MCGMVIKANFRKTPGIKRGEPMRSTLHDTEIHVMDAGLVENDVWHF